MSLQGKTLFITGASRGIGLEVALRAAGDGANIAIAAKTAEPHPKLPGTIYTAAEEIEAAGGKALPLICDIRFDDQVEAAVAKTVETFGGIDICINNASAISPTKVLDTDMKRFDLMHQINTRGTFLVSKTCLPHLLKAENPHIVNMGPPIDLTPTRWANNLAYWMAKNGMSLCVLGMSEEFREDGVAVNGMWPRGLVATAAVNNVLGGIDAMKRARKPEMIAEATYILLNKPAREFTGRFWIDEELLKEEGVTDFDQWMIKEADLDEHGHYVQGARS